MGEHFCPCWESNYASTVVQPTAVIILIIILLSWLHTENLNYRKNSTHCVKWELHCGTPHVHITHHIMLNTPSGQYTLCSMGTPLWHTTCSHNPPYHATYTLRYYLTHHTPTFTSEMNGYPKLLRQSIQNSMFSQ